MATSGSVDFNLTKSQLINRAFQTYEIIGLEESIGNAEKSYASDILNAMIKQWQAEGCQLWNRKEATLFLAKSTQSYSISSSASSWHVTNSFVSTTLSAAEAAGQTVLSITSTTGMTANDYIGIELDDGTRQWTTISTVDSSTQVTVAAALTGAAASGNTVVSYTSKINRPLKIYNARRFHLVDLTEVPIMDDRYEVYKDINKKSTSGSTTRVMYDKQLTTGVLYVWPVADAVKEVIKFTYLDPIEDFDSDSDNADFPQEWQLPIIYGLAYHLSIKFKQPDAGRFEKEAEKLKEILKRHDNEESPLIIQPDLTYDYY
jgi:hypothetical protein